MGAVAVVIVGAGPAGLAVSRCLSAASIDHVILERDAVGSAWRRERWDSLHALTPNWMNGLPDLPYRGADPDGFMSAAEVATRLEARGCPIDHATVEAMRDFGSKKRRVNDDE